MAVKLLMTLMVALAADDSAGRVLVDELQHLRSGPVREWAEFPEDAPAARFDGSFSAVPNPGEHALVLRQQDVKQVWQVQLNGKALGDLTRDENDMIVGFAIPAGLLAADNRLVIAARSAAPELSDDIRLGAMRLEPRPLRAALNESVLDVRVDDADGEQPLPCRITVLTAEGALAPLGTSSSETLAVRPGLAYAAAGRARLALPAGRYTVFAGRGFEYSLARRDVVVAPGETAAVRLSIRREVPTEGYVACDPHVHTLTHSGHGDATIDERMITLAGEGIELPVATDHNQHVDYVAVAQRLNLRQHFTPLVGNEVTTSRGHFNIFPVDPAASPPDHRQGSWQATFDEIQRVQPRVVILNHARDLHSGVRPFGPKLFHDAVAEHAEDWPTALNAMEVVNSGATQSDPLQLFHDWMALLNRGRRLTPIGSSDSHDVGRHFVGQARTYVRCDDRRPAAIPVDAAIDSLQQGRVLVSYGLLVELIVNERFRSGELATIENRRCRVTVRVLGPHWVTAQQVRFYQNGQMLRDIEIPTDARERHASGVCWTDTWELPLPQHDVHLTAVALGPGIDGSYWKTAKPYQPIRPEWEPRVIGCSGAVWLDADGDRRATSARDYAERLVRESEGKLPRVLTVLENYDAAVAAHAAHLLHTAGTSLTNDEARNQWRSPAIHATIRDGFESYLEAARRCERARAEP